MPSPDGAPRGATTMSDTEVRAYAAARRFSQPTLERWLAEPAADRDSLLRLAERLRLGENQFRDLHDDAAALAARDGRTLLAVLDSAEIRAVLDRQLGRNDAIKAIKLLLRRLRYPQLTAVEQDLATLVRDLRLPAGVTVELPANLEGEHVTVHLRAASAGELRAQAAALAAALKAEGLDRIFAVLEGDW